MKVAGKYVESDFPRQAGKTGRRVFEFAHCLRIRQSMPEIICLEIRKQLNSYGTRLAKQPNALWRYHFLTGRQKSLIKLSQLI
jgi:hypothetical protein